MSFVSWMTGGMDTGRAALRFGGRDGRATSHATLATATTRLTPHSIAPVAVTPAAKMPMPLPMPMMQMQQATEHMASSDCMLQSLHAQSIHAHTAQPAKTTLQGGKSGASKVLEVVGGGMSLRQDSLYKTRAGGEVLMQMKELQDYHMLHQRLHHLAPLTDSPADSSMRIAARSRLDSGRSRDGRARDGSEDEVHGKTLTLAVQDLECPLSRACAWRQANPSGAHSRPISASEYASLGASAAPNLAAAPSHVPGGCGAGGEGVNLSGGRWSSRGINRSSSTSTSRRIHSSSARLRSAALEQGTAAAFEQVPRVDATWLPPPSSVLPPPNALLRSVSIPPPL